MKQYQQHWLAVLSRYLRAITRSY